MPCFSLLKGLETQPWLGLCALFISFQARLCKLIQSLGEGSQGEKQTQGQKTNSTGQLSVWGGGVLQGQGDGPGGVRLLGKRGQKRVQLEKKAGVPLLLLPSPLAALPQPCLLQPLSPQTLITDPSAGSLGKVAIGEGSQRGSSKHKAGSVEPSPWDLLPSCTPSSPSVRTHELPWSQGG